MSLASLTQHSFERLRKRGSTWKTACGARRQALPATPFQRSRPKRLSV